MTPENVLSHLSKKRAVFIHYNIKRLHELIRNLSPLKRKLFKKIPLLLHINAPDFPGFVDNPSCPYGIYGFHESGFWKLSLKHGGIDERKLRPYFSKRYHILGLYLMGSSGTLVQSDKSDFDYWVLIDQSACTDKEIGYLSEKLHLVREWSRKTYAHEVNFFILDVNEIKENQYKAVDGESSGTAQKTILKEEFYRTFILIAGKIPYWAVTPAGIDDLSYNTVIDVCRTHEQQDKIKGNYIDLGNLTAIQKNECPGAILWHLYKSHLDPAKSLVKACLIAYFNFLPDNEPLPCDLIKKKFAESIFGGSLYDPYAIIFDKVTSFLDSRHDYELADAVRECIFLRLYGYLSLSENDNAHPKKELLEKYTGKWGWDEKKIKKFESYDQWPEEEKAAYDEFIVGKISILYEKVLKSHKHTSGKTVMRPSDFKNLRNRIAKYFRKKKEKLPLCSSCLRAKSPALSLIVAPRMMPEGTMEWTVLNGSSSTKKSAILTLYQTDRFMRAVAWIIANGLHHGNPDQIMFQQTNDSIPVKHMRRLFLDIQQFMPGINPEDIDFLNSPEPLRMAVVIHLKSHYDLNSFEGAECIIENTWGELFFHAINLSPIETLDKKCYELAEFIWNYQKESTQGKFDYRILSFNSQGKNGVVEKTEVFLKAFANPNASPLIIDSFAKGSAGQNEAFILDL